MTLLPSVQGVIAFYLWLCVVSLFQHLANRQAAAQVTSCHPLPRSCSGNQLPPPSPQLLHPAPGQQAGCCSGNQLPPPPPRLFRHLGNRQSTVKITICHPLPHICFSTWPKGRQLFQITQLPPPSPQLLQYLANSKAVPGKPASTPFPAVSPAPGQQSGSC